MAQSTDLVVPNTSAAGVRSGINTRLAAIATHQSGTAAPATTYPYQFWADTTAGLLKQRDGANSAWVTVGTLGAVNLGLATLASPTFTGTPAAPTAAAGTNSTQLATTAFVTSYAMPVRGTSQASTSGTSVDFTSIPSWVKRVTVMLDGVSLAAFNSESNSIAIRLGTSSGFESTNYKQGGLYYGANSATSGGYSRTDCFHLSVWYVNASTMHGSIVFTNISGNIWVANGLSFLSDGLTVITAGAKTLSGVLDRIRITTVGGTDTFDAGTINILYE
jgi:hypothetical protein